MRLAGLAQCRRPRLTSNVRPQNCTVTHNPYSAPRAQVEDIAAIAKVPRPIAVWLLVAFLALSVCLFTFAFARGLATGGFAALSISPVVMIFALAWRLLLIASLAAVAYGALRRRRWARWVGVLCILLLAGVGVLAPDTTRYESEAERTGGQTGKYVILPIMAAYWIFALAFSAKAKRYFAPSVTAA
jgi:hypothetical protein